MIHPTAIIGPEVRLGNNVTVGPYAVLVDRISVGENTFIGPHVVIGGEAEHSTNKYETQPRHYTGRISIGSNVVIREFTQICRPLAAKTVIGDHVYCMGHSYIAHDCMIGDHVVLSNGASLGGWTTVLRGANLGLGATVHQYSTIGHYAMIAANATVVKDVPPLAKYIPGKPLTANSSAVTKWNLPVPDALTEIWASETGKRLWAEWESARRQRPTH